MTFYEIIKLVGELVSLASVVTAVIVCIAKIINGQRCLLRSEMLRIYYHNRDSGTIRQYEYENFVLLYDAGQMQIADALMFRALIGVLGGKPV